VYLEYLKIYRIKHTGGVGFDAKF